MGFALGLVSANGNKL